MKLSHWADVAEILSGIAVVVTLVVLIAGVRENSSLLRASTYADRLETTNEFDRQMISDPELRNIFFAFLRGEASSLQDSQRETLSLVMNQIFRGYEIDFTMMRYGIFGDEEWSIVQTRMCRTYREAEAQGLGVLGRSSDVFAEYVRSTCLE